MTLTPSHGRGPNARAYDRLRAHETNPAFWYPLPGRYLRAVAQADALTASGGTIKESWASEPLDAAGWVQAKRRALHARISTKGGIAYSRHNDPTTRGLDIAFIRDEQRLRDIRRRIRVYQFECRAVRERFGHLLASYDD